MTVLTTKILKVHSLRTSYLTSSFTPICTHTFGVQAIRQNLILFLNTKASSYLLKQRPKYIQEQKAMVYFAKNTNHKPGSSYHSKTSALTILMIRKPSAYRFICSGISKVIYKYICKHPKPLRLRVIFYCDITCYIF